MRATVQRRSGRGGSEYGGRRTVCEVQLAAVALTCRSKNDAHRLAKALVFLRVLSYMFQFSGSSSNRVNEILGPGPALTHA